MISRATYAILFHSAIFSILSAEDTVDVHVRTCSLADKLGEIDKHAGTGTMYVCNGNSIYNLT